MVYLDGNNSIEIELKSINDVNCEQLPLEIRARGSKRFEHIVSLSSNLFIAGMWSYLANEKIHADANNYVANISGQNLITAEHLIYASLATLAVASYFNINQYHSRK